MPVALAPNDLHGLFLGAASNALWAIFSYAGQKCVAAIRNATTSADQIGTLYKRATEILADAYPESNDRDRRRIQQFLSSSELEAIARQYFSTMLLTELRVDAFDPLTIKIEFNKILSIFLDLTAHQTQSLSDVLFPLLLQECDTLLNIAIDNGALAAHEVKSSVRHHQLMGEIAAIKNNLLLLESIRHSNLNSILEFDDRYRNQVSDRRKTIQPPNLDTVRRIPIDQLFVTPMLLDYSHKKDQPTRAVDFSTFKNMIHRTVVLSNPGGGKSTLAQKLTFDLVVCGEQIKHYPAQRGRA